MVSMRRLLLGLTIVVILGSVREAEACSPCDDRLPLLPTARRAELVVVAVRVGESAPTDAGERSVSYAPFEIREVLKGTSPATRILVATQYGMCHYGPDVELMSPSVLFLEEHGGLYETVRQGCAARSLPVVDGKAVLPDISLSLDTLRLELGLLPAPPISKPDLPRWMGIVLLCLMGAIGLAAGFWLGKRASR